MPVEDSVMPKTPAELIKAIEDGSLFKGRENSVLRSIKLGTPTSRVMAFRSERVRTLTSLRR